METPKFSKELQFSVCSFNYFSDGAVFTCGVHAFYIMSIYGGGNGCRIETWVGVGGLGVHPHVSLMYFGPI